MLDAVLPWLKLGGLTIYVVLIFRWVRRHATAWPWRERKGLLYLLMFCALPIMGIYSALKDEAPPDVLSAINTTLFATLIASWFAILSAPERGHEAQDTIKGALIAILRVIAAFAIPMAVVFAIMGVIMLVQQL